MLARCGREMAERELVKLRSSTQRRREPEDEAEVSLRVMAADLAHVPLDILQRACGEYRRKPGQRFFPRAAGELLDFVNPMLGFRARAASRLAQMAAAADAEDAERIRLAEVDTIPDDEIAGWSPSYRATALARGWITQQQFDKTAPAAPATQGDPE